MKTGPGASLTHRQCTWTATRLCD